MWFWFWYIVTCVAIICLIGIVAELSGFFNAMKAGKIFIIQSDDGRWTVKWDE